MPETPRPLDDRRVQPDTVIFVGAFVLSMAVLHWNYGGFFPYPSGGLAHDYALFVPILVSGKAAAIANGTYFEIPWFSPSQCGGFPFFPDPNALYFSAPQALAMWLDPVTAVQATFYGFAAIGFVGMFLLLRQGFQFAAWPTAFGAVAFTLSDFYAHRMVIGHLTFHAFTLAPLILWALIAQVRVSLRIDLAFTGVIALCFAAMFHAGMVHIIPPVTLCCLAILILRSFQGGLGVWPWARLAFGGVLALLVSGAKLLPALALLQNFRRDFYALPGFGDVLTTLRMTGDMLFSAPGMDAIGAALQNASLNIAEHEYRYGIGVATGVVLMAALMMLRGNVAGAPGNRRWGRLLLLVLVLFVPIALNTYGEGWNAVLKTLPLFKDSTNLFRWNAVYVLVLPVIAACALHMLTTKVAINVSTAAIAMLIAVTCAQVSFDSRDYLTKTPEIYDPTPLQTYWQNLDDGSEQAFISNVYLTIDRSGQIVFLPNRNDAMAQKSSAMVCNQPIMGYALESFPVWPLKPGPALAVTDGVINIKKPECYLYPDENGCQPGAHFGETEIENATAFVYYRNHPFSAPWWHGPVVWLSAASLIVALVMIAVGAGAAVARRRSAARSWAP